LQTVAYRQAKVHSLVGEPKKL